jgi:hypothetical protein
LLVFDYRPERNRGCERVIHYVGARVTAAQESCEEITVSRSETQFRTVSWAFAAGSAAWLGLSPGAVVACLPLVEVLARLACGAGPV